MGVVFVVGGFALLDPSHMGCAMDQPGEIFEGFWPTLGDGWVDYPQPTPIGGKGFGWVGFIQKKKSVGGFWPAPPKNPIFFPMLCVKNLSAFQIKLCPKSNQWSKMYEAECDTAL